MPIIWEESYNLGIKIIDEQHKVFVGILNEACECAGHPESRDKLEEVMNRLLRYADLHFKTEEEYFKEFDYENAEEHTREHVKLKKQAENFRREFVEEKKDVAARFVDFLEDWLVDHLDQQDKKYVQCFHEHGLY